MSQQRITSHAETQSSPDETERKRDRPPEHKVKQLTMLPLHLPYFVYTAGLVQVILMLGASLRQRVSNK